ncbi:dihydrodipicolinate synthase family protein [Emcibacter sp.]|uniref:dihydrodipicolinate synthase family protein n=1 Tax=Emcibacter sp. TaxID=1979954 RepID=UPI002AA90D6F|nr:dihydrodipicolinate synthase family protein [Emcibacter sp.]
MAKSKSLLTVDDIVGAWAIMPTPAKPGSTDWRAEDTVDLDETARVVNGLIEGGVNGILAMGTLGECATLTWEEKYEFMATLVEAAAGRVPVFVGTTALNTRETIRQTKAASDLGADGTMLGVPMWCAPSVETAVQYYKDVAEACPDMAICVYDNKEAFKFDFPTSFWAQVASIPQVVTSKYGSMDRLLQDIAASRGQIRFLPIEAAYYGAARMEPDFCTAFWSNSAVCGPATVTRFRDVVADAKQSGDWSEAKVMAGEIGHALSTLFPNGSFKDFSMYNIILEKERMNAAGWMVAGPTRPPYHIVPEDYLEGAHESGRRAAALHKKYSS